MSPDTSDRLWCMSKLIVSVFVSADGFCAGPDDDLSVLPFHPVFNDHNLRLLEGAGTLLAGRRGFLDFVSYWPGVADDPGTDPVERAISRRNDAVGKLVVSDTLDAGDTGPWQPTTTIVPRADAADAVATRKRSGTGDVVIFGGRTTWAPLLAAGLVDELQLLVGAGLAGAGTPLFAGVGPVALDLLDSRRLEGTPVVLNRYAPA